VSALAVGALSACTPDEPTPEPSTAQHTSTPTPTPTPTPTVAMPAPVPSPTRPVEWLDDGEAGAEESARYFLELYRYTRSSRDLGPWKAVSHPDCIYCANLAEAVTAQSVAGETTFPAAAMITHATVVAGQAGTFGVVITARIGPDQTWSDGGVLLEETDTSTIRMTVVVLRQGQDWLLREIEIDTEQ
jgi:hypothetical protein